MAQEKKTYLKLLMAIGNDLLMEVPIDKQVDLASSDLPENCWGYQYLTHNVVELDGCKMMEADPVTKSGVTYVGIEAQKGEIDWDIRSLELKSLVDRTGVKRCAVCTHPSCGTMIFPMYHNDRVIHCAKPETEQSAA